MAVSETKAAFVKFLQERNYKKQKLYYQVVILGVVLIVVGGFGAARILPTPNLVYYIQLLLASFIRVVGICICSTVPTSEFDLCDFLLQPKCKRWRQVLFFVIAAGAFFGGAFRIFYLTRYSTLMLWLIIPFCIPCGRDKATYSDLTLFFLSSCTIYLMYLCISALDLKKYEGQRYPSKGEIYAQIIGSGLGTLVMLLWSSKYFELRRSDIFITITARVNLKENGRGWQLVYNVVYFLSILIGVSFLCRGIIYVALGLETLEYMKWFMLFVIETGPFVITIFLGPKKSFTLLARVFEYDIERLLHDGAMMAYLINSWDYLGDGRNAYWAYRETPYCGGIRCAHFHDDPNLVQRSYFLLGYYENDLNGRIPGKRVLFPYILNSDFNWSARYSQDCLTFQLRNGERVTQDIFLGQAHDDTSVVDDYNFHDWVVMNFGTKSSDNVSISMDLKSVTVYYPSSGTIKNHDNLLEFGRYNVRIYYVDINTLESLLEISPRALGDNVFEKERIFSLSKPFSFNGIFTKKIDFFISHSWEDNYQQKYNALRLFFNAFKDRHKRNASVWLDKVCINQQKPGEGLAVLPINIAACDKILVVLSKTYLRRLWCLWELFTLL